MVFWFLFKMQQICLQITCPDGRLAERHLEKQNFYTDRIFLFDKTPFSKNPVAFSLIYITKSHLLSVCPLLSYVEWNVESNSAPYSFG